MKQQLILWIFLLSTSTAWAQLELPAHHRLPKQQQIVRHSIQLHGKKVRNMTLCYDKKNHYPLWVAYPMHQSYLGNAKRTNYWHADPALGDAQPKMKRGMGNGHDRGHMLPSNARTATIEANRQTFLYSNMTAQLHGLNAVRWRFAEKLIHDLTPRGKDTLYVVTGAVLRTYNGKEKVRWIQNKNDKRKLPVPNYYYKVLLMRHVNAHGKTSYRGIALWMPHKALKGKPTAVDMRSIDWVEQKTGLNFFPQLPAATEKKVEAQCQPKHWI